MSTNDFADGCCYSEASERKRYLLTAAAYNGTYHCRQRFTSAKHNNKMSSNFIPSGLDEKAVTRNPC